MWKAAGQKIQHQTVLFLCAAHRSKFSVPSCECDIAKPVTYLARLYHIIGVAIACEKIYHFLLRSTESKATIFFAALVLTNEPKKLHLIK